MELYILLFILGILLGALISYFFLKLIMTEEINRKARKIAEEIIKKQSPIIKGKVSEELFPLLYKEIGNLSDLRFLGNPIDYIQFSGLSEGKEVNINFIEIKSGSSSLNQNERLVKEAVEKKRIEWKEIHIN
ncbi:MAG: Holliday junction resolvase-like protein [Candidatus Rehaiarchaeum fermentans]|nr:hypothetical protein [Candidatus Rehaiarchaeum fermentans]MCW1311386.1 hypothetical protein [Candidatus Rehaiarchaeum fermentans]